MTYHIVFNREVDLAGAIAGAWTGDNPRHSMAALADALGATVHDGRDAPISLWDRIAGKLTRTRPLWWAMARKLRCDAAPGDVIYCTGEDIGTPVAALCGDRNGVKVAMMAHYIDRPRGRLALRLFRLRRKAALICAVARPQAQCLQRLMPTPDKSLFVWDQTDTQFFSPGPSSPDKGRPMIVSVGLEQRDYGTLAAATADLDVDVRISGFSADARLLARAFPARMPDNMSRRFYSWPDLRQLYRDADIVVVSLFPNRYAAGVQGVMEALSSGRPVIVTATEGLEGYIDPNGAIRLVPLGDADAMRGVIVALLKDEGQRTAMAVAARALAEERHRMEDYVQTLADALRHLARPCA